MKVTVCQIDPRAGKVEGFLEELAAHIKAEGSQFLLLPEMCFSDWLAGNLPGPDSAEKWAEAIADHHRHITELGALGAQAIISTRPILTPENSRRNAAYMWTREAPFPANFHEKYYLPDEDDYYEASWYDRGPKEFNIARALGMRIGVQICTELWFFEWARHYARSRADLLCVPRATPHGNVDKWIAGGQAAAVCAGAYCLSSNLWAPKESAANLGGGGFIVDPEGTLLARTDETTPFASAEIDLTLTKTSKASYPRYVAE